LFGEFEEIDFLLQFSDEDANVDDFTDEVCFQEDPRQPTLDSYFFVRRN